MPVRKFSCKEHGDFTKLLKSGEFRAKCPRCGAWCGNVPVIPRANPEIREPKPQGRLEDKRPITMSAEELDRRIAVDSERAWGESKSRIEKAREAEKKLPPELVREREKSIEHRRKIQEVMLSEPPENLDAAGIKIWRRSEDHVKFLGEKYPDAEVKKTGDVSV